MSLPANVLRTFSLLILCPLLLTAQGGPADEVAPLIGTSGAGACFPGAVRPWGMVSVSPHTDYRNAAVYWYPHRTLTGFGHLHISGPGCTDMGDIELMPTTGPVETRPRLYESEILPQDELAAAGYYRARLQRYDITAEMTATTRCGISRYTYPSKIQSNLLINVTRSTAASRGGYLRVRSAREVEGWNTGGDFCGGTAGRRIYFVARLDQPAETIRTWSDSVLSSDSVASANDVGVSFSWGPSDSVRTVGIKVGISYVSIANARQNLDAETEGLGFDSCRSQAREHWNRELGKVRITGGSTDERKIFYTALYHALLHPNVLSDVNGEYPKFWRTGTGVADGYTRYTLFGLWGTYRSLHPLLTLIYPEQQTDMARTMVEQYRESGWLPVFELSGYEVHAMVGDPATAVLVDTWTKGLRGFDITTAYQAMLKSAFDGSGRSPVRFDLDRYRQYGYVPMWDPKEYWFGAASATLEYAYADWHLARLARLLGHDGDAYALDVRGRFYRNIYEPTTGFFRPRNADGSWYLPFDPFAMTQDERYLYDKGGPGGAGYNEGNGWHHLFMVPHDVPGLAGLMGGNAILVQKLQLFFNLDQWIWNENVYGHPYLFTYFPGEEWRTPHEIRKLMKKFTTEPHGLPGSDDTGSLSSWYVFNALGFYPHCTGSGEYRIGAPFFRKIEIDLDRRYYPGDRLTIDAATFSQYAIYARTVSHNGVPLRRRAISHDDLVRGGVLSFEMSSSRDVISAIPAEDFRIEPIADLELRVGSAIEIGFTLGRAGATSVAIYDLLGRRVALLLADDLGAGRQRLYWSPEQRGVYTCVVRSGDAAATGKIVW